MFSEDAERDAEDYFTSSEPKDFSCSSDQPCPDAGLKLRQPLNSALAPEGVAASSFQTELSKASSVLRGAGSPVSAPIQSSKRKECKERGQKGGEEGEDADTGREQVRK